MYSLFLFPPACSLSQSQEWAQQGIQQGSWREVSWGTQRCLFSQDQQWSESSYCHHPFREQQTYVIKQNIAEKKFAIQISLLIVKTTKKLCSSGCLSILSYPVTWLIPNTLFKCLLEPEPAQWAQAQAFSHSQTINFRISLSCCRMTHFPSVVVSIPLRSAWTLKLAIICPSFFRNARIVFRPL